MVGGQPPPSGGAVVLPGLRSAFTNPAGTLPRRRSIPASVAVRRGTGAGPRLGNPLRIRQVHARRLGRV